MKPVNRSSSLLSKVVLLICSALLIYSGSFFYPRWKNDKGEAQISWDAGGYYWYLPSAFIYHDIGKQQFKDSILQQYQPIPPNDFQYAFKPDSNGNYVVRYTIGTALLESPAFFIAHAIAKPLGYPADGFSMPYQFMIYLGGLVFALLGLWYLRKLLLLYFTDNVVAITLFLLVFGTNYLNYAGIDVGMTHTWLFTLYVFMLLNTHYFYQTFKTKYALRLGLLIGIATLVRPPEIIAVLIPLLWGIDSISIAAFKERLLLFKKNLKPLLAAFFIGFALISLQFIYWKIISGHWFVYTYQDQGFSWLQPNLKKYALNYQCGWLMYTPVMFFTLIGFALYFKRGRNKVAVITLILINYYIVASWNGWEYGGRAMVQNYPVLLFPLATFVQFVWEKKWRKIIFIPLMLLFSYFNIWWTYQAHRGTLMGGVPATGAYYWKTIFRYNLPLDIQKLRDNEDLYSEPVQAADTIYNSINIADSLVIVNDIQDSITIKAPAQKPRWVRASADFHINQKEWNVWFMTQFFIRFKKGNEVVQENSIHVQRLLNDNETKNISVDAKVRHKDFDTIEILFRNENKGSQPCVVKHLTVIGFDK